MKEVRILEIKQSVFADNDRQAQLLRQELKEDIARRGLTVVDDRGRQTENRSVSLSVQVSRQMMALFTALGFKPGDIMDAGGDDEL